MACRLLVGEQVGEDGSIGEEAQLLVDDADAVPTGIVWRGEPDELTPDVDLTLVRHDRAGHDLHERGLAGTVLADDGMDGPDLDREVHVDERPDAPVRMGQSGDGDRAGHDRRRCGRLLRGRVHAGHPVITRCPRCRVAGYLDSFSMGSISDFQLAMKPSTAGW